VRVNGTTSPLIIIKTVHTVEFELPSPYDTHPLGELTVDLLGTDFSGRTEAKMLLTLSARPRAVTGTQKLVQLVMKILLTISAKGAMTGSVILESVGGAPVTVPVVI
jgi:hypothetical protein